MAEWNGYSMEGRDCRTGLDLGLPAAFPRKSTQRNGGGTKNQSSHQNPGYQQNQGFQQYQGAFPQGNDSLPTFFNDNMGHSSRSYNLTESDYALAASSTLTPTAGEFVPRSQSVQANRKKTHQNNYEARPKPANQGPMPTKPKQDSKHVHSNRPKSGYDTNQKRYYMEDAKTQDRQRLLSEAASYLTYISNPEPASSQQQGGINSSSNNGVPREPQYNNFDNGSRYPYDGNIQANFDTSNANSYGGRNQPKYENGNGNRRRNQDQYDRGYHGQGGGNNWRGNNRDGVHAAETFPNSRNSQSRQGCDLPSNQSSPRRESKPTFHTNKDDNTSQRERLIDQLTRGALECLVCCDRIKQHESVWSCLQCFHVLHLRCVTKWALSSRADNGWRCPACQYVTAKVPDKYFCFCGQCRDPEWNRRDIPHSCGEVCQKLRASRLEFVHCEHRCNLLCHPGPCPTCNAQVQRFCGCGATSQTVRCGGDTVLLCGGVCGKKLNCGQHSCEKTCHMGSCGDCEMNVEQMCFCGKEKREVQCTSETFSVVSYACSGKCDRTLACGNHTCRDACHEGECQECQLSPDAIKTCPCGKMTLTTERTNCLDEIPTCGQTCEKRLNCGQPSCPHQCKQECHVGPCPPCPLSTLVRCRCGNMDKEIPCGELTTKADDARCTKKCSKKRSCGKHKCSQMCCIDLDHVCPLTCNHQLSCGHHRCEELCHRGRCKPCFRIGWEELLCECGKMVTLPPIPCGTRPPECQNPCTRAHPCDHPVHHNCHSYPSCPPCTQFTSKYCYGNHLLRKNIPCFETNVSCGLPCDREMPCGRHKCVQVCHKGPCLKPGAKCVQPCTTPRPLCGHNCNAVCHEGACPDLPCKETVKVSCECGNRSVSRACAENAKEYQQIATSLLASKMADMQLGHTVDIADLAGGSSTRKLTLKSLDCNEECKVIERNRRLAIGLQIVNPDLSAKLTPRYSEFMRGWAKKDPHFCQVIHTKLTELVQLAKQSKQKSRSYSFEPMNRDKRHFVHECCEHFGCQSEAYDPEPKRNVVATAVRDKVWLPSMSLMEVIQRESGVRKIPKPVINFSNSSTVLPVPSSANMAWRSVPGPNASQPSLAAASTAIPKPTEPIDYFDFTP